MAEAISTPKGSKRKKKDGTPTPVHEASGSVAKKNKGDPIPMENPENVEYMFDEIGNPEPGTEPSKSYAKIVLEQSQREAMKLAPPWAKVILTVIRDDIKELKDITGDMSRSITHNDLEIKKLVDVNKLLTQKVANHQVEIDSISLRCAKIEVAPCM